MSWIQKCSLFVIRTSYSMQKSELHFARSFQGYPTWPYLAWANMHPNMAKCGQIRQIQYIYKRHFYSIWSREIEWHFTCFVKPADFYIMAGCSFILSLIQILQRKIEGEKLCVKSWHRRMEKSEKQVFIKVEKSAKLSQYQIRYFLLPWPLGNVTRTGEKGG